MLTSTTIQNNNAWYRQVATGWARRLITGSSLEVWAQNTGSEVQFALSQLRLRPGDRVLDLGCGWGRHSLPLAAYGLSVTGVDLSRDLLVLARYNARRYNLAVDWVEADVANLPLRGWYDAIVQFCSNLTNWFADRDQALEALWHVTSLLRPGGSLVLGTDDWQPDLPQRSQHWDEWDGGAAIYRQRYDRQRRVLETQTVVFGPEHQRQEYWRQTWWPSRHDMELMFAQVGLVVCGRYNGFANAPYRPDQDGLVYVLAREE